jgi:hypothetical protein
MIHRRKKRNGERVQKKKGRQSKGPRTQRLVSTAHGEMSIWANFGFWWIFSPPLELALG